MIDRIHRKRALHRREAAYTGVTRFEFQTCKTVGDGTRTRTVVAFEVHPQQAEFAEFGRDLTRQDALLEPIGYVRQDALADEFAHGVAHEAFFVRKQRIESEKVEASGLHPHLVTLSLSKGHRLTKLISG